MARDRPNADLLKMYQTPRSPVLQYEGTVSVRDGHSKEVVEYSVSIETELDRHDLIAESVQAYLESFEGLTLTHYDVARILQDDIEGLTTGGCVVEVTREIGEPEMVQRTDFAEVDTPDRKSIRLGQL